MESCLKYLPQKSYNTAGRVLLTIFALIGVFVIGIAGIFESKAPLQCDPNKRLASDLPTRKYIDTQCLLKYAQEFQPFLPLYVIFMLNFGFVLLLSIIYAYSVEHRVKIFVNTQSTTTNIGEEESQPLMSEVSQAAADPIAHQKSAGRYVVFTWYVVHLIISRIIPLVVFAVVLLSSSNFPVQYQCQLQAKTTSSSRVNFTQRQNTSFSTVDCVYPTGSQKKNLAVAVVTIDFLVATTAFVELIYLLQSAWNDDNLLTDREFCCFYLLRKSKRIRKLIKVIRKSIPEDTFYLYDDFGEEDLGRRKLEEMYINVIIQEGREMILRTRFENRHESYETHLKPADNVTIFKNIEDLFQPMSKYDPLLKSILVVGRPGIGKTLLTKKILRHWQKQSFESWRDKIVILIRFRTFNMANGRTSLQEALRRSDGLNIPMADFNTVYEYICLMPSKVVLIFDGLDELIVDEQYLNEERIVASYNEETHILLIFKQLLKGQLLPGVTVIITSRPTAQHIYNSLSCERKAEILGFHKKQIQDYVKKFCGDDEKSSEIWNLIKQSPELLSLCYIPVNSYIVCLTLKKSTDMNQRKEANDRKDVPRTITELYNRAVKILLFRHHLEYKYKRIPTDYIIAKLPKQLQIDLVKPKEIAMKGMVDSQLIFEFQSDNEFVTKLSKCGLLNKLKDKERHLFCFLHLTIQEFLAAQHVVDDVENVESFLSEHIDDPRWHLVILFVAGLIGDKIKQLQAERTTENLNNERTRNNEKCKGVVQWFYQRFKDCKLGKRLTKINQDILFLIRCVHEMQEVSVMESIASLACSGNEEYKEFLVKNIDIAPVECTALFEFISRIKNLNKLTISLCRIEHLVACELANKLLIKTNSISELDVSDDELKQKGATYLRDSLKNVNCKLIKLRISGSELTADSAKYFSEALKSQSCKLTELHVDCNELFADSTKYLSEALKSENCKLTELDVGFNKLTDDGAGYLREALKSENCKLTTLNVANNKLTDDGAIYLSQALKSQSCKLTKLDMAGNKLTDDSAKYLSEALKSENCKLTELDMGFNKLTDDGAKYLSEALKSQSCKLTELDVAGNKITAESAKYLSEALQSENCKLTKLDVGFNELTDDGARYLSDALESENCKLTELNVACNKLTDDGGRNLSDALKSENCKLTELNVARNELTADGARYLSDALKSENCKLTKLNVARNELTAGGARYLSDALKSENCKLTELNVTFNKLTADGAKYLSDALKSQSCKLTILVMKEKGLTDDGIQYLRDALKNENCKLTKLWVVAGDKLTADGARYLSDALKNENCKLTEIHVTYNTLTAGVAEYLSVGLKSQSRKHTKLDVAGNKLTDDGIWYLSDALKSENCKLTELRVAFNELTDDSTKYLSEGVKSQSCKLVRTELVVAENILTDDDARYLQLTELDMSGNF